MTDDEPNLHQRGFRYATAAYFAIRDELARGDAIQRARPAKRQRPRRVARARLHEADYHQPPEVA